MGLISIDGNILKKMLIFGANNLSRHSQELDALNVFPVPDGDTGINMSATVTAAAREVLKINSPNIYEVAKAASNGALRGARGNSGVILSQLYRGFAKGLEGKSVANAKDLTTALTESSKMAYKAVMKPKEGTILSVAKEVGEAAKKCKIDDIGQALTEVIKAGNAMLARTPDMLPELKKAGVVDSGGKGLMYFYEGALEGLLSKEEAVIIDYGDVSAGGTPAAAALSAEDIKFGYCTEFLVEVAEPIDEQVQETLTKFLSSRGDSVVVVSDDTIVKVHVHTNNPGVVLERCMRLGSLDNIKIDNMRTQHTNLLDFTKNAEAHGSVATAETQSPAAFASSLSPAEIAAGKGEEKDVGFVAVVAGAGLARLFTDIGADEIIEGGQTMNPSAETIAEAVSRVNAKHVVVLPNNKNIQLAAEQAALLVDKEEMYVIPTKSVPQGIACLVDYFDGQDFKEYLTNMNERLPDIHTGQVTYAVRDTVAGDFEIKEGDILSLYDGRIIDVKPNIQDAAKGLIDHMMNGQKCGFISIYYGEEANEEMAQELADYAEAAADSMETEVYNGQQPLYYYIISAE